MAGDHSYVSQEDTDGSERGSHGPMHRTSVDVTGAAVIEQMTAHAAQGSADIWKNPQVAELVAENHRLKTRGRAMMVVIGCLLIVSFGLSWALIKVVHDYSKKDCD